MIALSAIVISKEQDGSGRKKDITLERKDQFSLMKIKYFTMFMSTMTLYSLIFISAYKEILFI